MRIDGKRASAYTNYEINLMLRYGTSNDSLTPLTEAQKKELHKVLKFRFYSQQ